MDNEQFTSRVLEAEPTLYHISKSILKNDFDCADAVQEAILKAFVKLPSLREEKFFKTWLCRILIRECYKIANSRKRAPAELSEYAECAKPPEDVGLRDAIEKLCDRHRVVVVLHYMEGFKTREIAQMLKIPEGTVKSRLARAKNELKQFLDEEGGSRHEEVGRHLRGNARNFSQQLD